MQTYNYSDKKTISGYVSTTDAQLKIKSVPMKTVLEFPAFLTDFSQTFDAKWSTEDVFGRMDPIATYQGTKRTMSIGFDLPAGSLEEAKRNLHGCSELVKMVYPVYGMGGTGIFLEAGDPGIAFLRPDETLSSFSADGYQQILAKGRGVLSKPPLVRVKFANLITGVDPNGLLGWISGLSWKPNLEMGMFAADKKFYPKVIALSFSFNVLHEQTLSQNTLGSFPFGGK
jgi:hypothetical protein